MKLETIEALAESYINGNINDVKMKVRTMNKIDFVALLIIIRALNKTHDFLDTATILTN